MVGIYISYSLRTGVDRMLQRTLEEQRTNICTKLGAVFATALGTTVWRKTSFDEIRQEARREERSETHQRETL